MSNVTFDGINRVIQVSASVTGLDVQTDLYSEWKQWVREADNAKYPYAFTTVGGEPLGATTTLGRYFFLQNNWKLRTDPGQTGELLIDGNLFTVDASNAFTQSVPVIRQEFSSLTVIETVGVGGGGGSTGSLTDEQSTALTATYIATGLLTSSVSDVITSESIIIISQSILDAGIDYLIASGSTGSAGLTADQEATLIATYTATGLTTSSLDTVIISQSILDASLDYLIASGSTGSAGLTPDQETKLLEIYRLMGLDPTKPLIVTPTSRTAGSEISQSLSQLGDDVTVTRQ